MSRPTAPLFAQMKATEEVRATTPTNQPVVARYPLLSPELVKHLQRMEQSRVDHIKRRDRNWDDALRGQS